MIRLIGRGGAGKTTVGGALARRLGMAFVDLDGRFTAQVDLVMHLLLGASVRGAAGPR